MPAEPGSVDPARFSTSEPNYLMANLHRGLYRYESQGPRGEPGVGLTPEDAQECVWKSSLKLVCRLKLGLRWSDGSALVAADYERGFRRLVAKGSRAFGAELLLHMKSVRALGPQRLEIEFTAPDPDFLYKLASTWLAPAKQEEFPSAGEASVAVVVNGPYRIASWSKGKRLRLESNPHFRGGRGAGDRPPVEVLFVDDDETALDLYRKGTLAFLRRLPTTYIAEFRGRPDFYQIPMMRFDYVGFGPELADYPRAREAFSLSLNFEELAAIFHALGRPGCPSIPESFMDRPRCLEFDLVRAREAWESLPEDVRARRWKYKYSSLGGDDSRKGAEWMQAQWKRLGARVDIESAENALHLASLRAGPPALFRKGVTLDRPTCLSALETFAPNGPDNFLKVDFPEYARVLKELAKPGVRSVRQTQRLCGRGMQTLLDRHLIIPQGRIHFTLLASPEFEGWRLNEMNQLDLAGLRLRSPTGP